MGVYASQPRRLAAQLVSDFFVAGWVVLWAAGGIFVRQAVAVLAGPARETARTAARLSGQFTDAADQAGRVPGVGDQLRRPFDGAAESLRSVVAAADQQVDGIERLALVCGLAVFVIPVAVVVALWLPRRIRFARQARAMQTLLESGQGVDLFALRALATQPLPMLTRISPDPVAAWRLGDTAVIAALAELELNRGGLRAPPPLSPPAVPSLAGPRIPGAQPENRG